MMRREQTLSSAWQYHLWRIT